MGVSVLDLVGQIVYYPDMASIVGKKRGNKTYYYPVTSARWFSTLMNVASRSSEIRR